MFEPLLDAFTHEKLFESQDLADGYLTRLRNSWVQLFETTKKGLMNSRRDTAQLYSTVSRISQVTQTYRYMFNRVEHPGNGFRIESKLPLFSHLPPGRDSIVIKPLDDFAFSNPFGFLGVILYESGKDLEEIFGLEGIPFEDTVSFNDYRIQQYTIRYASEKATKLTIERAKEIIAQPSDVIVKQLCADAIAVLSAANDKVVEFDKLKSSIDASETDMIDRTEALKLDISKKIREAEGVLVTEVESRRLEWRSLTEQWREQVEAVCKSNSEGEALKDSIEVWNRKCLTSRLSFWGGLLFLAGIIGAGVFNVFWFWRDIQTALPTNPNTGELRTSAILLIVGPIVAVAWVLRIFARFVTNAMTLGDDADQRRAMISTYLRLVSNPTASIEQSDRILILNAIFRPLPGHQVEDVAPPTLLELTKEALTSKAGRT